MERTRDSTMNGLREYLTRKESAEYLRISLRTFDDLVSKGLLPKFRVSKGRIVFRRKDLDDYVESNRIENDDGASAAIAADQILGK